MSGALADSFRRLIAREGPISLLRYMGEANARYYAGRDPLGAGGDFTTAPEISQMFGELVGLWLADLWRRAGGRQPVRYVELGPGRGTLARDVLRVLRAQGLAPDAHFVEASPPLIALQRAAFPDARWHADLGDVPDDAPLLIVANEFLDALPIRQLVRTPRGWRERMVGLDGAGFVPVASAAPMDAAVPPDRREAPDGAIIETCPGAAAVVGEAAARVAARGGAALFIDYGHDALRLGSTLQAVRRHRRADPFAEPGEADLTAHVDFATLRDVATARGARVHGPVTQGAWLRALGIETRAARLAAAAPARAEAIGIARDRLIGDEAMGALFKVMGLVAPHWPDGAGF